MHNICILCEISWKSLCVGMQIVHLYVNLQNSGQTNELANAFVYVHFDKFHYTKIKIHPTPKKRLSTALEHIDQIVNKRRNVKCLWFYILQQINGLWSSLESNYLMEVGFMISCWNENRKTWLYFLTNLWVKLVYAK